MTSSLNQKISNNAYLKNEAWKVQKLKEVLFLFCFFPKCLPKGTVTVSSHCLSGLELWQPVKLSYPAESEDV